MRGLGARSCITLTALFIFQILLGRPATAQPALAGIYKASPAPLEIETVNNVTLHDAKRNKDLSVRLSFPRTAGRYPVIIFSHGAGASPDGYSQVIDYWASYGYVVIGPRHTDAGLLKNGLIGAAQALDMALRDSNGWVERARDVSFILDSLADLERLTPDLKGRMDSTHVGVGGHSYGALTATAVGGATLTLPGQSTSIKLRDPRVNCILPMSSQGAGQMGLTDASWAGLTLPMMTMSESVGLSLTGKAPEWRKQPFDRSPAGDKYHVIFEGANHFTFGNSFGAGGALAQPEDAIRPYIRATSLAYWDAYLKDDAAAKAYLHSDQLTQATSGQVKLYRR